MDSRSQQSQRAGSRCDEFSASAESMTYQERRVRSPIDQQKPNDCCSSSFGDLEERYCPISETTVERPLPFKVSNGPIVRLANTDRSGLRRTSVDTTGAKHSMKRPISTMVVGCEESAHVPIGTQPAIHTRT